MSTAPRDAGVGSSVWVHAVPQVSDHDELARQVAAIEAKPGKNLLVVHGAVNTLKAFSHAEFNELTLDPSWFDDRFDYVALGHYHGLQEVTAKGKQITVVLNGQTILDADLSTVTDPAVLKQHPGLLRTSGHIGFLGHNDYVEFRNIRIKELR